jgi:asparagine synthase (glutamine-hydrolysing)
VCGIVGSVNLALSEEIVNILKHRGPDDIGTERVILGGNEIYFGHRRLSIVDLSPSGHQPMSSSSGNHLIVYNGELYNHSEIRATLPSYPYKGNSDTETIVSAFETKGVDSIRTFNGIFAFGYLDKTAGKLYLVRDPFGVKPLYYWKEGRKMVFGSELKPLLRMIKKSSVDENSLSYLLTLRFVPSPLTLIKGIRKVQPGHIIEIDLNTHSLDVKDYSYVDPYPEPVRMPFKEAVTLYHEKFTDAVHSQLMSDVELGILLSGGVDSAMVAAIASKKAPYKMKAFTIGFETDDHANEVENARQTADFLGLDHYCERIDFKDFLSIIREITSIVEEPLATDSVIPMYYLSKLAASHVKVVLTGQGADEPLGGYRRYQGELLLRNLPSGLKAVISQFKRFTKNEAIIRGLNAYGTDDDLERFTKIYTLFSPAEVSQMTGHPVRSDVRKFLQGISNDLAINPSMSSLSKMMAIDLRFNLADDLLLYTDKISMHHSIEARVPMLDRNLINFVEKLPAEYKVRIGKTKIIHKAMAASFLPKKIIQRKKLGFLSPTGRWFRDHNSRIKEILLTPNSKLSNHIERKAIQQILDDHFSGYDKRKQIFLLLNLFFWFEEFTGTND